MAVWAVPMDGQCEVTNQSTDNQLCCGSVKTCAKCQAWLILTELITGSGLLMHHQVVAGGIVMVRVVWYIFLLLLQETH